MPVVSLPRRLAHRALDAMRTHRVGRPLLRFQPTRDAFNAVYERSAATKLGDACWRAVNEDAVTQPFLWHSNVHGRELLLPVEPRDPRGTWHAALNWSWSGHRHMRRFYEQWLSSHRPGVFFDVGANYGTHTLPLALHDWLCVAFEPQRRCLDYLVDTARLNGLAPRITVEQTLMSDTADETLPFYLSETTWTSSVIPEHVQRFEHDAPRAVAMRTTTVDAYVQESGLVPDLIKIDVEGWELHVLRGARATIEATRPTLLVEVLARAPHRAELYDFLTRQLGYRVESLEPRRAVPIESVSAFVADEGENYAFTSH